MSLLETKDGLHFFAFEHGRDYQQVQFKFFDAVESMDPNNIVVTKSEPAFTMGFLIISNTLFFLLLSNKEEIIGGMML